MDAADWSWISHMQGSTCCTNTPSPTGSLWRGNMKHTSLKTGIGTNIWLQHIYVYTHIHVQISIYPNIHILMYVHVSISYFIISILLSLEVWVLISSLSPRKKISNCLTIKPLHRQETTVMADIIRKQKWVYFCLEMKKTRVLGAAPTSIIY